jgi:endonuclease/exonuclease/phosphatase family metal-dependent hydrolase
VYVNPEKSWFFAFFGLGYPFLLLGNLLFVVFWILKKKKFFLVPLIAILIGWSYISSLMQISLKKTDLAKIEEPVFSIISYNVRLFDVYDWNKEENTSGKIFEFINSQSPDFICFQEYYTKPNGQISESKVLELLHSDYGAHINYTNENSKSNYGIATYSRYPIVNRGVIQFSNSTNSSIYTDIVFDSDTVRIFNCHLQSIRFNRDNYSFISNSKELNDEQRIKEIRDISSRLRDAFVKRAGQAKILSQHIKNSPYPVIVCGDFNDVPVSYTYQIIKEDLNDSFTEAGTGIGNTYLGKFPSFRIDYILHSDDIKCVDYDIPRVELSDHYPVIGKFHLLPETS